MIPTQANQELDDILIAMANQKRRAILKRLAGQEVRVTEIAASFDVSLNAISKHIKLLERAGLVQRRRSGREHLLRFRPEPLRQVEDWIVRQRAFWQASLAAIDEMLQQEDLGRSGSQED